MTAIMKKLKSLYLNKRIKYVKKGERFGWEGTIYKINSSQATIHFDNGIKQSYRLQALHYEPKSYIATAPYLVLTEPN